MAILGNSRQLLAIFENFRQPFENLCQPMATYVNLCQLLETVGNFLRQYFHFTHIQFGAKSVKNNFLRIVQFSMKMGWGVQSVFYKVYPVYASSKLCEFIWVS